MKQSTLLLLSLCLVFTVPAAAGEQQRGSSHSVSGLQERVRVTRDKFGIAHIEAANDHDLYFMQGYVHAKDRLFQMDVTRRQASGTLAELLGVAALAGDAELRTIGVRRAAERSLSVISVEARAALEAYADGVNAFVAGSPTLPPEYKAIEITGVAPWSALDSMTIIKAVAFSLAFNLEDIDNSVALLTYSSVLDPVHGPGTGLALFSEDLFRAEPFTHASTVPDASTAASFGGEKGQDKKGQEWKGSIDPAAVGLVKAYGDRVRALPFFKERMNRDRRPGSNEWAVSGRYTASGSPLIANDPHLPLGMPSTFYPIRLTSGASDAMGSSFAGIPFVVVGQTRDIAWGATVCPMDITDVFQEQIAPDPSSPSGLSTIFRGQPEHVVAIPETYRVNVIGDGVQDNLVPPPAGSTPPATLIVPRRNNGPIVQADLAAGTALSVQHTGFSGTRELDSFRIWNRAHNLLEFQRGLKYFASGTLNLAFAETRGTIAYFATSEVPLREDLQAGTVTGAPPWFIRNGAGGNEWVPVQHPQPGQSTPYEILPASEMPHLVDPPAGWFVNANNDPDGTVLDNNPLGRLRPGGGIYYLGSGYFAGLRAGRITERLEARVQAGRVSFRDMQSIQADVVLPDAQYFTPIILRALARAKLSQVPVLSALGGRADIQEAVARLGAWSFTAPTGIPKGYDAADVGGYLGTPSNEEIAESVAATIYSVWRGQFLRKTIDATLEAIPVPPGVTLPKPGAQLSMTAIKALLERPQPGVGASGIDFFSTPDAPSASAEDRRDIVILRSLADALARLAGAEFAAAFGNSTNQATYRWGKLHRIVLEHPLGGSFNAPPAFGALPHPLGAALPGVPTDGGFGAVDVGGVEPRAQSANEFMFNYGASDRFVAEGAWAGMRAESIWPGGASAIPGNPFYLNQLPLYLTNDTVPLLLQPGALHQEADSTSVYVPAN